MEVCVEKMFFEINRLLQVYIKTKKVRCEKARQMYMPELNTGENKISAMNFV